MIRLNKEYFNHCIKTASESLVQYEFFEHIGETISFYLERLHEWCIIIYVFIK